MRIWFWTALAALALTACEQASAPQSPSAPPTPSPQASNPAAKPRMTTVPPLKGTCDLQFRQALEAAGLVPKPIDVHGPVDADAQGLETGCPYRIEPSPGTQVAVGSTVTYRSWYEQGDKN